MQYHSGCANVLECTTFLEFRIKLSDLLYPCCQYLNWPFWRNLNNAYYNQVEIPGKALLEIIHFLVFLSKLFFQSLPNIYCGQLGIVSILGPKSFLTFLDKSWGFVINGILLMTQLIYL